jgi:hypothetical protein
MGKVSALENGLVDFEDLIEIIATHPEPVKAIIDPEEAEEKP